MKIVLIDTKNPNVEIEILMTGTKLAACHQKMADCDDLAVCSKLEKTVKNANTCVNHLHNLNGKKTTTKRGTSKFEI